VRHTIAGAPLLEADRGEGVPDQAPRGERMPTLRREGEN
jgi:hypothetical protein